MNSKNISGLLAMLLLIGALIGTVINSNNVPLLVGLACFNWITFQAEQIKDRLK